MKKDNTAKILMSFTGSCRGKLIASVFGAILSVAGSIVPYFAVYQIIWLFFEKSASVEAVFYWSLIALAGYFAKVLFYGISTTLSHFSAYTILEEIRLAIAEKLMSAPLGTVLNDTAGKIKNTLVDRVETIELPLAHLIPEGISNLLLILAVGLFLLFIDLRMALAALISVPLATVVYAIMMRDFGKRYDTFMKSSNQVNGVMVEYVEGIEVIKAFGSTDASYQKFSNAVTDFKNYTLDWFHSTWKLMNLGGAILPTTLLGSLPVGLFLYLGDSLSATDLVMCLLLPMGIVAPLTSFTVFINDAKSIQYAIQDANTYLNLKPLSDSHQKMELQQHHIQLKNVSFSYDGNRDHDVLHQINLNIREGQMTAFVGPSGGGKSTIAKLIARFWDVSDGDISIDNVNIRDISLDSLADKISFVTQDNFLFNCSLLENIRLGNPAVRDEAVYQAAKAACCDDFIRLLPDGYQTDAGVAGTRLSGGEKQRIAIARAILKNAPIILLDEATAFTDPENEDKIQASINALNADKTLVVVAHRLSTIKHADQIVVVNQGRIEATGTHQHLLDHCPLYRQMWHAHIRTTNIPATKGDSCYA